MKKQELQHSDYRIRKLIGILGLLLPILLPLTGKELLSSISHYYYKPLPSIVFIIILSCFALFLISYKGYKIDKATEKLSDDLITNIGGLAALLVVFIPTRCAGSESDFIDSLCGIDNFPLLGHDDPTSNTIHLVSAGIFIVSMGWMSRYKFTRGSDTSYHKLYRTSGLITFIAAGILLLFFSIEFIFNTTFSLTKYDVFIFETIAIIPFAVSWLVKGQTISYLKKLF
ncbi:hypothetical protein [Tenacibaculum agarivorans]|uniref:hypothetical protein n=1 Tax=Tenacibaculum agarivorans TaxID=1908389 RepID=UPI00094BABAB|nr:hypothetical protein [Tenacibaculum agarivorans]